MKKQKKSKLNEFIQHTIDCESYGNNTVEVVTELLQSLFEQISKILKTTPYVFSKGVYNQLLKDIEAILEEYRTNVTSVYEIDIKDIASYQSDWMKEFLSDLGKSAIIPAYILFTLKFNPVANASNYKDLIDNSVYKIRQSVESSLRTAYITQEEMSNVTARFENRKPQFEKNIIADTKVVSATTFSAVNYLMYKANKVNTVYCAILDSKTCIPCAELNGKEFEYKDQPILPQHHGCRCALIPTNALSDEEMPESFEQWFESLSEEEKIEAVGPERYKLYQAGVPVTKFVDNQNKQIPVKELKRIIAEPDINQFPKSQVIKEYADLIPNKNGYFDVAMHGTSQTVQYGDSIISARELAKIIEHNKDFDRQKGIRLLSCNTGNGSNCFAQQLANALNCNVIAPNDILYIYSNGMTRIGDDGKGKWITFTPGNK